MKPRPGFKNELMLHAFAALAWLPVLVFLIYSVNIRIQGKYFIALLAASGLDNQTGVVNTLFLYRNDLLLFGVLIPLLIAISFGFLRRRTAIILWSIVIAGTQLLLYSNLQSWGQVGRFLNWLGMSNAIAFGLSNPSFVGDYISLDGLAKLAVLLIASGVVFAATARLKPTSGWVRLGGSLSIASVLAAMSLSAVGFTSSMRNVPMTGSFLVGALQSILDDGGDAKTVPISDDALNAKFKDLTLVEASDFRGRNFGVEAGSNLLLFVMETGSIEFLDVRAGLPEHPVLARLKERIFVAKNHYSTFPASAESNLSLLAGFYPPRALYGTCLTDQDELGRTIPGYVQELRSRGYQTKLYAPFKSQVPADRLVFEHTGFAHTFYGVDHNPEKTVGADGRTLKELSDDIAKWTGAGQRFAAAFFPQIGHGPWSPSLGASIKERGHRLAMEQLDWLDGLVKQLERGGQLTNTVIVITGDHGVRTSLEDPRVRVGMIDQYSLHVPLLIYAPHADFAEVDSRIATSHVDVATEMFQLFGFARSPALQGLSFSDPKLRDRRQFFVAGWYYGADGYRDPQEAAMYSSTMDAAYLRRDRELDFRSKDQMLDGTVRQRVKTTVDDMMNLQESWIKHRVCGAK